jgi:prepilin-type N-terminal cleavage/methylation domain-containing protein
MSKAFTLFEMMVVLVVLVILAAVSVPLLEPSMANQRLHQGASLLRTEWATMRLKAMNEGKIYCCRVAFANDTLLIDRVLDVHFTAALSTEQEVNNYRGDAPPSILEDGGFTGEEEDFILRDPDRATDDTGAKRVQLPKGVFFADAIALPDERAFYYLGLTEDANTTDDENTFVSETIANQEVRLGESSGSEGITWSVPIFFFPDGTTSTAAVLLKNERNRCIEVRLRGLTATTTIRDAVSAENYVGEMNANTQQ